MDQTAGPLKLSKRERQIAEAYASGSSYRNIAEQLFIAPSTVRTHLAAIYRKLGVSTKIELGRALQTTGELASRSPRALSLPDKPSIAVLPFLTFGGDHEQEHFADGLVEDLITELSRNAGLFVIARNSSFTYKGKVIDVRRIAQELGVRYLLEGSARRAARRIRIHVQLIDATSGIHLWTERFDRELEDIFAVQDEVTTNTVQALLGRLTTPLPRRRPSNLEAYDLCARARGFLGKSPAATREAQVLLDRALALEPDYAEAQGCLAVHLWLSWAHWGEPMEPNRRVALQMAENAARLDPNDGGILWGLGIILAHEGCWDKAETTFRAALERDPNNADAWAASAEVAVWMGRSPIAIQRVKTAMRLNPHPPAWYYWELGLAQYVARDYLAAVVSLREESTYRTVSRRVLAAALAQLGRLEEARHEASLFMANNPHFTIGHWASTQPFQDRATLEHLVDGYRKAGLPE